MAHQYDLVIRGGVVVDGGGGEPFEADVAITGGRITDVGRVAGSGREEIDTRGSIVTPGFVDLHTHLDGNITFESQLKPCSGHGVTTAITGNCGVGFAPVRRADQDLIIRLMEGVEDIPFAVLKDGLPWAWESFPEYMDYVAGRRFDMDVGVLTPHSALRVYVMGERGMTDAANAAEISEIARLAGEAARVGALGFGTSRLTAQRSSDGSHIPSLASEESELTAIAQAMNANGGGVLQIAPEFNELARAAAELEMLARISKASNRPVMYSLKQNNREPEAWRDLLDITARANADDIAIHPQVLGRPTGAILSLECSGHLFVRCPSYKAIADKPLAARVAAMRDPQLRETMIEEAAAMTLSSRRGGMKNIFEFGEPLDYEPEYAQSLEAKAERLGIRPQEIAYDQLMSRDGHGLLLYASGNYAQSTLDPALGMMRFPGSVPGLGDGGAHSTVICDASISTFMLSYWTRDRTRGERMSLPAVVQWLTQTAARAIGLNDRGLVRRGYKADLNVIDYERLALRSPRMVCDLPAGGKRLVQDAQGYVATIVSGEIVRRNDQPTEKLPGRLVRGAQRATTN